MFLCAVKGFLDPTRRGRPIQKIPEEDKNQEGNYSLSEEAAKIPDGSKLKAEMESEKKGSSGRNASRGREMARESPSS